MSTQREAQKPQEGTVPADEGVRETDTPDEDLRGQIDLAGGSSDEDQDSSQGHDDPGSDDDGDAEPRPHGNREAARYRVRAREAEQKLAAVTAELEALKDENFIRDLGTLYPGVKGATLHALGLTRESVTGEDGTIDEKAVRERAEVLVREHGLRPVVPGQPPVTGDKIGPFRVESGASWTGLLGGGGR